MAKQTDENGVVIAKEVYSPSISTPKKIFKSEAIKSDKFIYLAELSVKDGVQTAEPGQKVDWDAYIQSSKSSCDLENIIARYLQGDATVVNVGNPISGDIASLPHNVNQIQDLAEKVKKNYDGLSDEIKNIFGGSFEDFYNAVLSNEVDAKIAAYASAKVKAAQDAAAAAKLKEKDKGQEEAEEGK